MPANHQSFHIRGFTLIEAALSLCIIALIMGGVFLLAKNVQDDIVFEKSKNDTVQLLNASRSYLEVQRVPVTSGPADMFQHIKVPDGFAVLPADSTVYQTSYSPSIGFQKTTYNSKDSLVISLLFYSNKFMTRYCDFFQSHFDEYNLQAVTPGDCTDTSGMRVILNAYTQNGE